MPGLYHLLEHLTFLIMPTDRSGLVRGQSARNQQSRQVRFLDFAWGGGEHSEDPS